MAEEITAEASATNQAHLELRKPLPEDFGDRVMVRITPLRSEQADSLGERAAPYKVEPPSEKRTGVRLNAKEARIAANQSLP